MGNLLVKYGRTLLLLGVGILIGAWLTGVQWSPPTVTHTVQRAVEWHPMPEPAAPFPLATVVPPDISSHRFEGHAGSMSGETFYVPPHQYSWSVPGAIAGGLGWIAGMIGWWLRLLSNSMIALALIVLGVWLVVRQRDGAAGEKSPDKPSASTGQ